MEAKPSDLVAKPQPPVSCIASRLNSTPEELEHAKAFYLERYQAYGMDLREPYNVKIMAAFTAHHFCKQCSKGMFIYSKCGTGKTLAMRILKKLRAIPIIKATDAVARWQNCKTSMRSEFWEWVNGPEMFSPCLSPDLIIDDMGAEATLNDYGTKQEVLSHIIDSRCELFERNGSLTIITSNLQPEQLAEKYGDRCLSRIRELCNIIPFAGEDQRKNPTKKEIDQ